MQQFRLLDKLHKKYDFFSLLIFFKNVKWIIITSIHCHCNGLVINPITLFTTVFALTFSCIDFWFVAFHLAIKTKQLILSVTLRTTSSPYRKKLAQLSWVMSLFSVKCLFLRCFITLLCWCNPSKCTNSWYNKGLCRKKIFF